MKRPSGSRRRLVILSLTLAVFGAAYFMGALYRHSEYPTPVIAGVILSPPPPLPRPDGTEDPGSPISSSALRGHWSLLMLDPHPGHEHSPALVRLLQIHNRLADVELLQSRLHYLYLSRHADETTLQGLSLLGDNLQGLSLPPRQADAMFRHLAVDPEGGEWALYLIGPDTRLHALFTPGEDAATIAQDLTTLITDNQ